MSAASAAVVGGERARLERRARASGRRARWRGARSATRGSARSRSRTCSRCYAYIQPVGYRHAYPTLAGRLAFAHSFAGNEAHPPVLRLPVRPGHGRRLHAPGASAGRWRSSPPVFGLLAAVRALRTEEDTGRMELVLAGGVGRGTAYLSAMAAIAAGIADPVAGGVRRLPRGRACRRRVGLSRAGDGVASCRCSSASARSPASSRRRAGSRSSWASATVGLFLLLRVIADTSSGAGWLRWATPLGWAEELRPFTGARPLVLLLPVAASALLLAAAARIAAGRDVGTGVLPARDSAAPRLRLLSSPTAQALRSERGSLIVWLTQHGRVRAHPRHGLGEHLLRGDLQEPAARDRQARLRLDRDAHRLSRVRVHLLHPRRQPVRVRADRRRQAGGGRRAARDAARPAGQPPRLARRAPAAGGARRRRDLAGRPDC